MPLALWKCRRVCAGQPLPKALYVQPQPQRVVCNHAYDAETDSNGTAFYDLPDSWMIVAHLKQQQQHMHHTHRVCGVKTVNETGRACRLLILVAALDQVKSIV